MASTTLRPDVAGLSRFIPTPEMTSLPRLPTEVVRMTALCCPEAEEPPGKNVPLRSCPSAANGPNSGTLVAKLPGAATKLNPSSFVADQVMVAWFSKYVPAKPLAASWMFRGWVTGPPQTTSKDRVASTSSPSADALG